MSGFSHEVLDEKRKATNNQCQILHREVSVLEGHHAIPKCLGGSNNPHNCIMLAGYDAVNVYGVEEPDIHEIADQKALKQRLFLHPDTLEYVTADKMPDDCFRKPKEVVIRDLEIRGSCIDRKRKKKKKHKR